MPGVFSPDLEKLTGGREHLEFTIGRVRRNTSHEATALLVITADASSIGEAFPGSAAAERLNAKPAYDSAANSIQFRIRGLVARILNSKFRTEL